MSKDKDTSKETPKKEEKPKEKPPPDVIKPSEQANFLRPIAGDVIQNEQ
jgi:hypothetical protein